MSTAAAETCAYHPDLPAAGTCAQCTRPTCLGCQMTVAGKNVCQRCVAAIRARIAAESELAAVAPLPPPLLDAPAPVGHTLPGAYAPAGSVGARPAPAANYMGGGQAMVAATRPDINIGNYLGGAGLGILAGLVGTIAWVVLVYLMKFNLSLLAIADGYLIGIAVVKGAGNRGGQNVAILSAVIALVFLGLGAFLTSSAFFGVFCVVFGVLQAYKTPMRFRS